jgi:hypothetical protein
MRLLCVIHHTEWPQVRISHGPTDVSVEEISLS